MKRRDCTPSLVVVLDFGRRHALQVHYYTVKDFGRQMRQVYPASVDGGDHCCRQGVLRRVLLVRYLRG